MRKINIPKEYFITALADNKTLNEMCKELNVCRDTVKSKAKEYNIVIPKDTRKGQCQPYRQFKFIDKEWLINNWVNTNKSLNTLATEVGCTLSLLENRTNFYELTKKYKYSVNTNKLTDINDPVLYYLAGLIATDGHMWTAVTAQYIDIGLVGDSELELLNNLNTYYNNERPVKHYKDGCHVLSISQDNIHDIFNTYFNIPTKDKTFEVSVPTNFPTEECAIMYVRGCLDGDGSIGKKGECLKFYTGSYKLVNGLAKIIEQYTGVIREVRYAKTYPGFEAAAGPCYKILDWVYSKNLDIKLGRKYDRYMNRFK